MPSVHSWPSLERLVKDEFRAQWRHLYTTWEKPLPERVASGHCVEALEISKILPNGELQLHCAINRSRFREGDLLCSSQGDPRVQPATLVTLELDEETDLVVFPSDERVPVEEIARLRDGWTLDVGMLDLSAFYLEAINQLGETTVGRERILPFLMGKMTPKIDQAD